MNGKYGSFKKLLKKKVGFNEISNVKVGWNLSFIYIYIYIYICIYYFILYNLKNKGKQLLSCHFTTKLNLIDIYKST